MKKLITTCLVGFILFFATSAAFAQTERACSSQVLSCRLEKFLPNKPSVLLGKEIAPWDGTNSDEPSIPPSSCNISIALNDDAGVRFQVNLSDADLMANVFAVKGRTFVSGDTAFRVTAGSPFYYRVGQTTFSCTLSK